MEQKLLFDLGVNLEGIKTLNQQMTLLRNQMDALVQLKDKNKITDEQYAKKSLEYREKEASLERQIAELRSQSIVQQNREAEKASQQSKKLLDQEVRDVQRAEQLKSSARKESLKAEEDQFKKWQQN
ncbi:hypothetical protein, partial [Anaerospora hongkongensis]|uniref:hypothetical protein n=1 Tax=Anaerospora hongkongensis TaxID=244830 RepID=UPI002FD97A7C